MEREKGKPCQGMVWGGGSLGELSWGTKGPLGGRGGRYTYLRDEVDGGRRGCLGESLLIALQLREFVK